MFNLKTLLRRKTKSPRAFRPLEQLESRTLLTSITIATDGKSLAYTDVDGDQVAIKITRGDLQNAFLETAVSGFGVVLYDLNLTDPGFAGTGVAVTVKKSATGDGLVNIGLIDATGNDLGAVSVAGDLGRIIAGDNATPASGLKSLTARSMGRLGLDDQSAGATSPLASAISGMLGALSIKGDMKDAIINITGNTGPLAVTGSLDGASLISTGDMGLVKIGGDVVGAVADQTGFISSTTGKMAGVSIAGSLIGGDGQDSGKIKGYGSTGPLKITGDIIGGNGPGSGSITAASAITSISVGGSLIGGANTNTGQILFSGATNAINIAHDIIGGGGILSGYVQADTARQLTVGGSIIGGSASDSGAVFIFTQGATKIAHNIVGGAAASTGVLYGQTSKSVSIGGSVTGGGGDYSGRITFTDSAPLINIAGNIIGGSDSTAVHLYQSGVVVVTTLGTLNLGGSLRAGTDNSSSFVILCGAIIINGSVNAINIKGSMLGTLSPTGDVVQAVIRLNSIGFKSLKIGGRMERALVLAGYQEHEFYIGDPSSHDVQLGAISVGGDMVASSIVAGAQNIVAANLFFGDNNDALISAGNPSITSAIASVTIGGQVYGTPSSVSNADHFGIVAESIHSVKIGGVPVILDPQNIFTGLAIGPNGDFIIHEVFQ